MSKISMKYRDKIRTHLLESAEVKKKTTEECQAQISEAVELITRAFQKGRKIMICGNGGSAADSQHFAGEFVCVLNKNFNRPALPAIALTTDSSIMTARANDTSFEDIFSRQVEALGKPGDVLVGISTSGTSANVLAAIKTACQAKIHTILLTGNNPHAMKIADVVISVPSTNTQYIQESHLSIEHIICELVEENLFGHGN